MHKLLARQLKRASRNTEDGSVDYARLLELVDAAYAEADKERQLNQRAIDLVSEELMELNRRLKAEAEARLTDALESLADGFALFDGDGRAATWNRRFAEMYPAFAAAPGNTAAEGADYARWRRSIGPGRAEAHGIHRVGDGRWVRTTERPTSEGGIVAVSTDISELKRREADLERAKEQAELANQSKSMFLANMSHELRTPLNAIMGFAEVIGEETLGPIENAQYRQYARIIVESGLHLLNLINDILDLARIEAGRVELNETEVSLATVIGVCCRILEGRAADAGVRVESGTVGEIPPLWADERALRQILLNLLSNSVKFTPRGGRISVAAWRDGEGGVVVRVTDTGIGISPEKIPEVLQPFRQVDAFVARSEEGTGLGLPLVKSLAELHGGALTLSSMPGSGTVAEVRLPPERVLSAAGVPRAASAGGR